MGLFKQKQKDGFTATKLILVDGIPNGAKTVYTLTIDTDKNELQIRTNPKWTNGPSEVILSLDKITDSKTTSEKIEVDKHGHPLARAVVGGAVFGAAGAVVGAISAKDKTKTKVNVYRNIFYQSNSEDKVLVFKPAGDFGENKFFKKLHEIIDKPQEGRIEL